MSWFRKIRRKKLARDLKKDKLVFRAYGPEEFAAFFVRHPEFHNIKDWTLTTVARIARDGLMVVDKQVHHVLGYGQCKQAFHEEACGVMVPRSQLAPLEDYGGVLGEDHFLDVHEDPKFMQDEAQVHAMMLVMYRILTDWVLHGPARIESLDEYIKDDMEQQVAAGGYKHESKHFTPLLRRFMERQRQLFQTTPNDRGWGGHLCAIIQKFWLNPVHLPPPEFFIDRSRAWSAEAETQFKRVFHSAAMISEMTNRDPSDKEGE